MKSPREKSAIRQLSFLLLILLVNIVLFSCASTDDDITSVPVDTASDEESLAALEQRALGAISRAETVNAKEYSPEKLNEAHTDLDSSRSYDATNDGTAKRQLLNASITKADEAYEESLRKAQAEWLVRADSIEKELAKRHAELYMPRYDARIREQFGEMRSKIESGDRAEAFAIYRRTLPAAESSIATLDDNQALVLGLKAEAEGLRGETGKLNARGSAASSLNTAEKEYQTGLAAYQDGDLEGAERGFQAAVFHYNRAKNQSSGNLDSGRIDELMRKVQAQIEGASKRDIVDSKGESHASTPWSGEAFLSENPLRDLSNSEALYVNNYQSRLKKPVVGSDFFPSGSSDPGASSGPIDSSLPESSSPSAEQPLSWIAPIKAHNKVPERLNYSETTGLDFTLHAQNFGDSTDPSSLETQNSQVGNPLDNTSLGTAEGSTSEDSLNIEAQEQDLPSFVDSPLDNTAGSQDEQLSDGSQEAAEPDELLVSAQLLLKQAQESWQNGVLARNEANFSKAQFYFDEAAKLVDQYNIQYAIMGYYVVRQLSPEDCLWRIAGYSNIYNDPFQWNRIYQRNRDIIDNPRLIYPGQRLVIPPPKDK